MKALRHALAVCCLALLLTACGERPRPARTEDGVEVVGLTAKAIRREHVPLLGAQVLSLGGAAPTFVDRPLSPMRGTAHYGSVRLGDGTPMAFALLESPQAEDGREREDWLLFVDSGLANDLTREPPVRSRVASVEQGERTIHGAHFPPVAVNVPGSSAPSAFMFDLYVDGERSFAEVRSALHLTGEASIFGDEPMQVAIFDANANGVFGDVSRAADSPGDALWLDRDGDGQVDPEKEILVLTPRLFVDGRVFSVEFARDFSSMTIREEPAEFGRLHRAGAEPGERLVAQVYSDAYGLLGPLEDARLPEGEYQLIAYEIGRDDGSGEPWSLVGGWLPRFAPRFVVRRGEDTSVRFGPPVKFRVWADHAEDREGRGMIETVLGLRGAAGEDVRIGKGRELADWGACELRRGGDVLARGDIRHMRGMPGAGGLLLGPVEGVERGAVLTVEAKPEFGPWSDEVRPSAEIVYGRRTSPRLMVSAVTPGSQAAEAGVRTGDIIISHGGRTIESVQDMGAAIQESQSKPSIRLVVLRDGQEIGFDLVPGRVGVETMLVLP